MARIRTLWADIARLYREHYWIAVLMWLPSVAMTAIQRPVNIVGVVLATIPLTLVYQATLSAYGLHLQHRIDSEDSGSLHVRVDGIDLGAVPENEYAAMRHRAAFSVSTYLRQLCNVGVMAVNFCRWMARYVPLLIFWIAVGALLLDSTGTVAAIRSILLAAQVAPGRLADLLALFLVATLFWSAIVCALFAPRQLGFRNEFRTEWQHALRKRLNLPSTGEMSLYRMQGNDAGPVRDGAEFRAFLRKRYRFGAAGRRALGEVAQ
nr:hypothetical protein [uncultured Cupriavidus sp.]